MGRATRRESPIRERPASTTIVLIVVVLTAAWLAYHEKYLNDNFLSDEEEKKLIAALIMVSTGVEDVSMLKVPAEVGRSLLQCYDDLGKQ